jgi:mono/diheme cytochrome c family protein
MKSTCPKLVAIPVRLALAVPVVFGAWFVVDAIAQTSPQADAGLQAFEVVRSVFQHPRCQNCHIPGDAPLQGNAGHPHDMNVMRGPDGHGAVAMECAVCHTDRNLPASYGDHVPPGAPNWRLPPPQTKMIFIGLSPHELCESIKDRSLTGGRDLKAMLAHVRDDKLVAWGWAPGGQRTLPPVTRAETVAAFKTWIDLGALCPM